MKLKMVAVAAASFVAVAWSIPDLSWYQDTSNAQTPAETTVLNPNPPSSLRAPTVELSATQRETLLARKRELEKGTGATTQANPPTPAGLAPVEGQGTDLVMKR